MLYNSNPFVHVLYVFHLLANGVLEFQQVDSDIAILEMVFDFAVVFELVRSDGGIDSISIVVFHCFSYLSYYNYKVFESDPIYTIRFIIFWKDW